MKNDGHELVRASVLVRLGDQQRARDIYERLLAQKPDQPRLWQNLGHVLKTQGAQAAAVHAYRQAVTRESTMGEAWWSLANLKTVKLGAADIAKMEQSLGILAQGAATQEEDVFHLHFALGKALEDAKDYAASFRHYDRGNRLRRTMVRHDADDFSAEVAATAAVFTGAFIAKRGHGGCPASDPIFIVGLPRSGSTLVEQILASHSQVEGTMELPEMMMIASRLQARVDKGEFSDFGTMVAALTAADRLRLGEEYIERTRVHRQTGKPHFIDKLPNNWQHVGLIRLILPNARIIDARRHPMSCCFSGWKQHFARGQTFSYETRPAEWNGVRCVWLPAPGGKSLGAGLDRRIGRSTRLNNGTVAGWAFHMPVGLKRRRTERTTFDALAPHLRQMFRLSALLGEADATTNTLETVMNARSDAIVLLDADGSVRWASSAARQLSSIRDGLGCSGDRLVFARSRERQAFAAMLVKAAQPALAGSVGTGGQMLVERPSGKRAFAIQLAPAPDEIRRQIHYRCAFIVTIHDPDFESCGRPALWRGLFGLTASEARVALLSMRGIDDASIAVCVGIGIGTVRSHQRQILAKTETRSKAELAHLLTRLG